MSNINREIQVDGLYLNAAEIKEILDGLLAMMDVHEDKAKQLQKLDMRPLADKERIAEDAAYSARNKLLNYMGGF